MTMATNCDGRRRIVEENRWATLVIKEENREIGHRQI
jgi:hypothetical protein